MWIEWCLPSISYNCGLPCEGPLLYSQDFSLHFLWLHSCHKSHATFHWLFISFSFGHTDFTLLFIACQYISLVFHLATWISYHFSLQVSTSHWLFIRLLFIWLFIAGQYFSLAVHLAAFNITFHITFHWFFISSSFGYITFHCRSVLFIGCSSLAFHSAIQFSYYSWLVVKFQIW